MNNIDKQYRTLLKDILDNGVIKTDRTGTGTISVFGRQIRHKMSEGFPLLTTKKMPFKTIVTELLWFLRGDTNIKFLVDNGCHIWDGDAYKRYVKFFFNGELAKNYENDFDTYYFSIMDSQNLLGWPQDGPISKEEFINKIKTDDKFAKQWGELGPIYGKQWRGWTKKKMWLSTDGSYENIYDEVNQTVIDQISILINDLKTNPDSRRLMVNAWAVDDLPKMVLPPCHYGFQVYTRELSESERFRWYGNKIGSHMHHDRIIQEMNQENVPTRAISLMWNQRSVDTFLGLPFNIASYGLLLEIIAKIVNMVPDELIGNLGDTHLYSNHVEQAKEQIGRNYTPEERHQMLKDAMGSKSYMDAVTELVPFGGGMSEYYNFYKIPYHTRESFDLPTLKLPKTDAFWKGFDVSLFGHLNPEDFKIENYQSHPTIKAPLSN
jgi:thymidylate synthase